ncbi:NrsF family protein [Variovorax sp. LARHSF232]
MKTDDLISLLATGVQPVPRRAATRRLGFALLAGLPLAALFMLTQFGLRRDLVQAMFWPMLWVKILFPFFIAWGGFVLAQRLARPGVRAGRAWIVLVAPVLFIWAMGALSWFGAPSGQRMVLLLGETWRTCVFNIALISVPVFVAAVIAMRGLAPTRPVLAGAAVGALAGGAGATVYALHCPEITAPFLAVWYVLGMLVPVAVGAVLGPRLFRW